MMTDLPQQRSKTLSVTFISNIIEPGKYHDGGGAGLYLPIKTNEKKFLAPMNYNQWKETGVRAWKLPSY